MRASENGQSVPRPLIANVTWRSNMAIKTEISDTGLVIVFDPLTRLP